jgi:hypothetical protein
MVSLAMAAGPTSATVLARATAAMMPVRERFICFSLIDVGLSTLLLNDLQVNRMNGLDDLEAKPK